MNVRILTILHHHQRYATVGDWQFRFDDLFVNVSSLDNEDYEFLVGLHEMIEAYLCLKAGISEESVTEFDTSFAGVGEPGDDPRAPYHNQHKFAMHIEQLVALELGVDWEAYADAIDDLSPAPSVQPPSEGNTR